MVYPRGTSRSTPANVQCQKCLKRDMFCPSRFQKIIVANFAERHYSYECKATAQERPYVSRPSRTQQLCNPKLVPKLTNDAPNPLEKSHRKGAADEELSKKEAERERRRELDEEDDESDNPPRRLRSPSVDSVSTVSTDSRSGSRSPPRRIRDRHGSESGGEAGEIADSPPRRQPSRSRSPRRSRHGRGDRRPASPEGPARRRRDGQHRRRSRSPRERDDRGNEHHDHRGDKDSRRGRQDDAPKTETRERSLSPFSQRLAMTRQMQR
ncbi:hypothetical protein LLEC1_03805 [Akanthomyces lecanii]|uniref:Uncharacterized protein n=1 Tax=Cordyceps confragosa TaxID=2714763 RepID=A0A179IGY0_CORDF|nr:hypothetical protein LLEC1_03805 [Akanthomyces lecanii]